MSDQTSKEDLKVFKTLCLVVLVLGILPHEMFKGISQNIVQN